MRDHHGKLTGSRLFERLAMPERDAPMDHDGPTFAILDSIKRHLVDLLNSHPGHSESAPELGLLDFNDATAGVLDLELNIRHAIRRCIERFEPRISQVAVESQPHDGDPLQLRFQVQAELALGRESTRTTIDLLLNDKRYQCLD
ncbi:type VI secretion system protein [Modicisalibacter ilicicola DSM 19980]|uniref:Type VI secretion system protein n=1 Tax=Modicisalibacter ilicicola DSM 19980 TaxID=1121942 RepID=A0A1M5B2W3_9GAMM|nr:type VI secretion system baseplate subunit TssE [Halomonas ilicicola]SHF36756.1 type VI secretion system protein [Halomonas ilicicola DSM 19980]